MTRYPMVNHELVQRQAQWPAAKVAIVRHIRAGQK